ncbi:hypothetical protein RclHR1_00300031 [Rhizophagus clarus]|uniref:C6 zinc finger domain-containing protein n=1 Tax=Rhizophagus clarus TaxID=94130 RepID=A0A2Z6R981_9GLOM|nr:hypothetical protein RclHR1_00300031 [Rhizophagus clarus]GES92360.1 C6 zinc finger domain-containing protein [Rhizophagus clarus]
MFYQTQYLSPTEQYQQEEQQRRELEQLLKQQLIHQSLLLSTPPPSPMSATLGHPNRSCASCKKRKVKCDRKTPSCTACLKSKHRCQYTSYSPPVFNEEPQQSNEDEEIKALKQKIEELDNAARLRWEHFQKVMSTYQPQMPTKDEFANPSAPYFVEDEDVYNLNLNNPVIPTSTGSQFLQSPPQSLQLSPQHQYQVPPPPQQPSVSYMLPQQQYQRSPNSAGTSPFIQTQNIAMSSGNYSPYMSGTIVLNYNLNAMRSFLGRQIAPLLQSMTSGQGPQVPVNGFTDVVQLQNWLRDRFLSQEWTEEMESYSVVDPDERFELRPIIEEPNQQHFCVRQKFEVILHRADFVSSPTSVHGSDFQTYDYDDKHSMEMENLTTYSETGSNRSSVADFDPTDVFLNKIYGFVRRFIRNLPWLRENFLANWRRSMDLNEGIFSDGVFSDVVVEVRKISSYNPYQDLKLVQNNEELIKGRLFF